MNHLGEIVSLGATLMWTAAAVLGETGSRSMGVWASNVMRMFLSLILLGAILSITGGLEYITESSGSAWCWFIASGFIGYTLGDYCLFSAYASIGARFGQLFMTLAPITAALSAFIMLGEHMSLLAVGGMVLTVSGIAMSILGKRKPSEGSGCISLKLPIRGVLMGLCGSLGHGMGLVMSKIGMYEMADTGFVGSVAGTMMRCMAGLTGFIILLFVTRRQSDMRATVEPRNIAVLTGMAFFGPTMGVSLSILASMLTDVGIALTIMSLTPVLILIPAYLIRHEKITFMEIVGAFISFAGVSLFFI